MFKILKEKWKRFWAGTCDDCGGKLFETGYTNIKPSIDRPIYTCENCKKEWVIL